MKEPKLCTAPNCGESIMGQGHSGQHEKCSSYYRQLGKPRPLPASQPLRTSKVADGFGSEQTRKRLARGVDYRNKQLDGLVARIEEKMRNYA